MQEYYVYFLLTTTEPVSEIPQSVALSLNKDCNDLSSDIPVQSLKQGPNLINYAVCLHKALFSISDVQVSCPPLVLLYGRPVLAFIHGVVLL